MTTFKKVLLPICSLFLVVQSYGLIRNLLLLSPGEINYVISFILSFLINLFVTGIFAFTGFAYSTNVLLPTSYYQVKNPDLLKTIYGILGIKYFKAFLLNTVWGGKNRKKFYDGTKHGFEHFIYQTKQSEFGHIAAFVVLLAISLLLISKGYYLISIFTTIINIIGNLYPVLLQRMHRVRIERVLKNIAVLK